MATKNSDPKFHEKLTALLEQINNWLENDRRKVDRSWGRGIKHITYVSCIGEGQFMDEIFQLCYEYFQYHLDEAKNIALKYQTQLAYTIDQINCYGGNSNTSFCDTGYWEYEVCYNIEAFNLMFGFIGRIKMDDALEALDDDWAPFFQVPQANATSNEIIAKNSDPEFDEKLTNLLASIKTWSINVCDRNLEEKTEKFMDELWPLYLDYFQYHLEEVKIASINHQTLLAQNIDLIQRRYVDKMFAHIEHVCNFCEYEDPPWALACDVRSRIEAFNDMFGFLETLNNEEFVEWLLNYRKWARLAEKLCDAPKSHWWWIITKLDMIDSGVNWQRYTSSVEDKTESNIVNHLGENFIKNKNE